MNLITDILTDLFDKIATNMVIHISQQAFITKQQQFCEKGLKLT